MPRRLRAVSTAARTNERLPAPLAQLAAARERAHGVASINELLGQLKGRCQIRPYCAARALGERKAADAVPALLVVVFNEHDVAAVEALGQIGDARALEPLLVLLEHWRGWSSYLDPQFFVALERAVVSFGDAVVERIEQLQAEGWISLARAWNTLALSRSSRAVQFLVRHMQEHPYPVMERLAEMGEEARALLFAVATGENESESNRRAAVHQLAWTAGLFQDEARRIVAALPRSWKEIHIKSRVAHFVTGNGEADVPDPMAAVRALLRHADADRRRIAVDLLVDLDARHLAGEVAQLATDESWMVRASVASALTRWGGPEDVPAALRKDPDVIVRGCTRWFEDALELRE